MSLSKKQLALFWRLFPRAWAAHRAAISVPLAGRAADRQDSEDWRRKIIGEECPLKHSLKTLANDDFDRIMLRLAVEAGDRDAIDYWAPAVERRWRHLLREKLGELNSLDPDPPKTEAYLVGLLSRSRIAPARSLDDLPEQHLRTLYQMLDTHLRRLRRNLLETCPF